MTRSSTDRSQSSFEVSNVSQVRSTTLVGVCFSLKPARGTIGQSASRNLLSETLLRVSKVFPDVGLLDLRNHPVPLFDGRRPEDRDDEHLRFCLSCVRQAGPLLLAVPAYWSGMSGVFKNFIDVLCGPIYDMPLGTTSVFAERPVGLLIVGADARSAQQAALQATEVMRSVGAKLDYEPVVVTNPRDEGSVADVLPSLVVLAGQVAIAARLTSAGVHG